MGEVDSRREANVAWTYGREVEADRLAEEETDPNQPVVIDLETGRIVDPAETDEPDPEDAESAEAAEEPDDDE